MELSEFATIQPALSATRGIVAAAAMYFLLWAFDRRDQLSSRGRLILVLSASAMAFLGLLLCAHRIATNIAAPREWDFLCFWTYGKALALGHSPYDVSVLREIAAPHHPSAEFLNLNYCMYPPSCLPLSWSIGYLSFPAAMIAWYSVQILALIGCILLLWPLWDESKSWLGLWVTLAVVLSWHSTSTMFHYAQTTFLMILTILLAALVQSPAWRGIWLGLAFVIKPLAAILAIDMVLRRQWRSLFALLVPPSLALGLFLLAHGSTGIRYYKDRNPIAGDLSFVFYSEWANQSLLGVLLRWFESPPLDRPIFFLPFVVLGGLLTAITLAALVRLPRELASLGIGYVVTLALLVYPGTLMHYSLFLLIPVTLLWRERANIPGGPVAVALTVAMAYGLDWSKLNFAAHLATWSAFTVFLTLASAKRFAPVPHLAQPQPAV